MPPVRLVCATANPGKVSEIAAILEGVAVLEPRPAHVPDVVENGETLEANARLKARAVAAATGQPAVADDTGLEVEELGGAPGVRSARFAGEESCDVDNVVHLLAELRSLGAEEPERRRARFRTVALVWWPDGTELVTEGEVPGTIAAGPRGTGGFGYDPVFEPEGGRGRTFAEMTAAEKEAISHRGRAFRLLRSALNS